MTGELDKLAATKAELQEAVSRLETAIREREGAKEIAALRAEIAELRETLKALTTAAADETAADDTDEEDDDGNPGDFLYGGF